MPPVNKMLAGKGVEALMPEVYPQWLQRAMDRTTPTLGRATVKTASDYVEALGGEVLFPTIRMGRDGLYEIKNRKEALQTSLDAGDYILVKGPPGKETADRATELSRHISDTVINEARFGKKGLLD